MEIFVFGSNLAGKHGKGSALEAVKKHGAQYGVGIGLSGNSYGIPTKDGNLKILPLIEIQKYIINFIEFARLTPQNTYNVVAIGCGLAGYKPEQIAPMFKNAPPNCNLPPEFNDIILK